MTRPVIPGAVAFKLHDTYGFPIDLTIEMADEQGLDVDVAEFHRLMEEQKARSRADAQARKRRMFPETSIDSEANRS